MAGNKLCPFEEGGDDSSNSTKANHTGSTAHEPYTTTNSYYQAITGKEEAARAHMLPNASDMHTLVMASALLVSTLTPRPKVLVHIFDHCAAVCPTAAILGR